jgi:hypothetical protein
LIGDGGVTRVCGLCVRLAGTPGDWEGVGGKIELLSKRVDMSLLVVIKVGDGVSRL